MGGNAGGYRKKVRPSTKQKPKANSLFEGEGQVGRKPERGDGVTNWWQGKGRVEPSCTLGREKKMLNLGKTFVTFPSEKKHRTAIRGRRRGEMPKKSPVCGFEFLRGYNPA